jgi:hypothetical protein
MFSPGLVEFFWLFLGEFVFVCYLVGFLCGVWLKGLFLGVTIFCGCLRKNLNCMTRD